MKSVQILIVACFVLRSIGGQAQGKVVPSRGVADSKVNVWLTDPGASVFFAKQEARSWEPGEAAAIAGTGEAPSDGKTGGSGVVIRVDPGQSFQSIDGWGWALTGGSAQQIIKMSAPARAALLKELFGVKGGQIGGSYLRVSIGASDLSDHVFSYDDIPAGQTDTALAHFDLGPDKRDVIPVLKEILAINPAMQLLGSPWSPPVWMKTNRDSRGGSLLPEYYGVYARYFVRYIRAMQKEGITIGAITIQNEPLHPGNEPSMLMPATEQAAFIKSALGPAFRKAGLKTKIIIYDHNADRPDYPISILDDAEARQYVDGSAFHLYGGKIEALSQVHDAYPDKNLYFTEQWVGAPGDFKKDIPEHVRKLIIGASRNWSKTVIEWNLASDPFYKPHTDRGGCDRCLGAVTIDGDKVTRNPAYYIIAQAAKFVRPGSVRIGSNSGDALPNVAFRTPEGKIVLIVLNDGKDPADFTIECWKRRLVERLNAGAVATYVW
ncbi:MAG TPA: glycoside hydrolase family 30 beta sandwich domain-containing protein [Puia sp.]|nr:glycoside hydrolase family 30 beta sandwich domain-containing protein [Puia sp.]